VQEIPFVEATLRRDTSGDASVATAFFYALLLEFFPFPDFAKRHSSRPLFFYEASLTPFNGLTVVIIDRGFYPPPLLLAFKFFQTHLSCYVRPPSRFLQRSDDSPPPLSSDSRCLPPPARSAPRLYCSSALRRKAAPCMRSPSPSLCRSLETCFSSRDGVYFFFFDLPGLMRSGLKISIPDLSCVDPLLAL